VFPQYLWWGPLGVPVGLALGVILLGAALVLRSVRMWPMAISFLLPFTAVVGCFAATGRTFLASWHTGPIAGTAYWLDICTSPELLIFVFFMMSDPRTAPATQRGRIAYGVATALVASAFTYFQPTEFGIKVGILASLTLVCAVVPFLDRLGRRAPDEAGAAPASAWSPGWWQRRVLPGLLNPAVAAVVLMTVAVPVAVVQLETNQQVLDIERGPGVPGARSVQ
jgi:Na+-translocating ferredoxin:NAD+ oxidoreductase RnfD subunit